jgi:hypothetical protein
MKETGQGTHSDTAYADKAEFTQLFRHTKRLLQKRCIEGRSHFTFSIA